MELLRSLAMLLVLMGLFSFPQLIMTQVPGESMSAARALDSLLQDYAYRALISPRTGTVYNGTVPENLTGIKVSALRLRSGSFFTRGVKAYNEFQIPIGVSAEPHVKRLALVYHNLGNWSAHYYPLPSHTYLAPVLGLLAYDAKNLSATNLPELDIRTNARPISITFSDVNSVPNGLVAQCVWLNIQGTANFSNLLPGNICSAFQQGHFSIVVESITSSPSPSPPPSKNNKKNTKHEIIFGSVLGGLAFMVVLIVAVVLIRDDIDRRRNEQMQLEADIGHEMYNVHVRGAIPPSAQPRRTFPRLDVGDDEP